MIRPQSSVAKQYPCKFHYVGRWKKYAIKRNTCLALTTWDINLCGDIIDTPCDGSISVWGAKCTCLFVSKVVIFTTYIYYISTTYNIPGHNIIFILSVVFII